MPLTRRTASRSALLLGASAAALILGAAPATAQDMFRKAPRSGASQAAEIAAARATRDQAASTATRRTIEAFTRAAAARQQMDAAQQAARAQAMQIQASVPNGLRPGGLQIANGVETDPNLWIGAGAPSQTDVNGRTRVVVDQTESKAILTWDSFNVGRETDLVFDQQGNTSWAVLNRVTDVSADPSRILGTIKADGTVMVLNRNGVIFGGASQVNARNIVAAAANMTNEQYLSRGIYSATIGSTEADYNYVAALTDAVGAVVVEAGALINATAPEAILDGGGYVMLLGTTVENRGSISTPKGQALLAAGDAFYIRPGYGTDANQMSSTRGNEVRASITSVDTPGLVSNTGEIEAVRGDITLTGRNVLQDGVLLATTSVSQRGTIHLLNSASDAAGLVTLTADSLTAILPELEGNETALNAQRDALIAEPTGHNALAAQFDNLSRQLDRKDQSLIEMVSGKDVVFEGGSTSLAQGGQISVSAARRIQTESGAIIDVSGVRGVALDSASNAIKVRIQGNELRDSPLNRDQDGLKSQDVWIDARDLILVPSGIGGYSGDRYYTSGGLLEVSGYLANTSHTIGEWSAIGGTITLGASEVVAKSGSIFNVAGGSIDYLGGSVFSTRLQGIDGRLYDINGAPAGMQFVSVGRSHVVDHARWGSQYREVYSNAMFNRGVYVRHEDAYSVGRDGGRLILSTPTALFEGEIVADTVQGSRQQDARPSGITDGYKVTQNSGALAGGLAFGSYDYRGLIDGLATDVRIGEVGRTVDSLGVEDSISEDRINTAWFDADTLNSFGLGRISLATREGVTIEAAMAASEGGEISLYGSSVDIAADLTARSGTINASDVIPFGIGVVLNGSSDRSGITLRSGVKLDATGVWTNALLAPDDLSGLAHVDGGTVSFRSTGDVTLESGSLIDVSSGGALLADSTVKGGKGGDVALIAAYDPQFGIGQRGQLTLDGGIRAFGMNGGGSLTLQSSDAIIIGNERLGGTLVAGVAAPVNLTLSGNLVLEAGEISPVEVALANDVRFAAGETAPVEVALGETVTLPAGFILPVAVNIVVTSHPPGQALPQNYFIPGNTVITLAADWTVPEGAREIYGYNCGPGCHNERYGPDEPGREILPAGASIYPGFGFIPAIVDGQPYILPADAFPNGLPLPVPIVTSVAAGTVLENPLIVPAGTTWAAGIPLPASAILAAGALWPKGIPLPEQVTLSAGTLIPTGARLSQTAAVDEPAHLASNFFQMGFSNYEVTSSNGIAVASGAKVEVRAPTLRLSAAAFNAPTGSSSPALELWTAPLFLEDDINAQLIQRPGANLSLRAISSKGDPGLMPTAIIGEGSTVSVDPGQSVTVEAWGQIVVDGTIWAPGGEIAILNTRPLFQGASQLWDDPADGLSVWLGETSRLDAAGRAFTATDINGRAYGVVQDGGSVILGSYSSSSDSVHGALDSSQASIVIRPGAEIDASGTSAALDLAAGFNRSQPSDPVQFASDGGAILISSYSGLYLDGEMRATAGSANAAGGHLALILETPIHQGPFASLPDSMRRLRILDVRQVAGESLLTDKAVAGEQDAGLVIGQGRVGIDQIAAGGFDGLTLRGGDQIRFDDGVNLTMRQSLQLVQGSITAAQADAKVNLAAPYVLLDGYVGHLLNADNEDIIWLERGAAQPEFSGELTVTADQLDIRNEVDFGASLADATNAVQYGAKNVIRLADDTTRAETILDFGTINLVSRGDIRLLRSSEEWVPEKITVLTQRGDLNLTAAQIYPATNAIARVNAGGVLAIGRSTDAAPDLPYSIFGKLLLVGNEIRQGGVVRAPLGRLQLGVNDDQSLAKWFGDDASTDHRANYYASGNPGTTSVDLLPGSITSVSAASLTIPYGGTADGINYLYNGEAVRFIDLLGNFSSLEVTGGFSAGVMLSAQSTKVEEGAILDLSGGGDVRGAGFATGRGGSVDILRTALINANPANSFSSAEAGVYALVPSYGSQYAPIAPDHGAGDPAVGRRITIPGGVPGLPAGAYTLLPSNFALLPGAFRVEIGQPSPVGATPFKRPDGSFLLTGRLDIANTNVRDMQVTNIALTPADVVRKFSGYNETSYSDFAKSNAAVLGQIPPLLPEEAKVLILRYGQSRGELPTLIVRGDVRFGQSEGGRGGGVEIDPGIGSAIEIVADSVSHSPEGSLLLGAADLSRLNAPLLAIGGELTVGRGDNRGVLSQSAQNSGVFVRAGAQLQAGSIFLASNETILVESGATISTLGRDSSFDSSLGILFGQPPANLNQDVFRNTAQLALSNGRIDFTAPPADGAGRIILEDGATLLAEGTLGMNAPGETIIAPGARFSARNLALAFSSINIGAFEAVAEAESGGYAPQTWVLNQEVLEGLLSGNNAPGAVKLESLTLSAGQSINFIGSVTLSTLDATTGNSRLALTFNTPAIYGLGTATDTAKVITDHLTWNGLVTGIGSVNSAYVVARPGPIVPDGPGTGAGTLEFAANRIVLGYPDGARSQSDVALDRTTRGFSTVTLSASERIEARNKGDISVFQSGAPGEAGTGGTLILNTPLLTSTAGALLSLRAGGDLKVSTPTGATKPDIESLTELGGEVRLSGANVLVDTAVALPSGRLLINADEDITLGEHAYVDLSGRSIRFFDQTRYSWGGDLILESTHGNVSQTAGSVIDLSAINNSAGSVQVTATDAGAGLVRFDGAILGKGGPGYSAGGLGIRAQRIGQGTLSADFAALNVKLNEGGLTGMRSFQIKQGDLTIGDEVRAREVNISIDGGSLTVDGTIDAHGEAPGTIRLFARDDLTLASTAVLDAHGAVLQTDSRGAPIEAKNRGHVELGTTRGTLVLEGGARIDLSTPDGVAYGEIQLNAPRMSETGGDVRVSALGPLDIDGARSIALNAFWTYSPTDPDGTIVQDNGSPVPVNELDLTTTRTILETLTSTVTITNVVDRNFPLSSSVTFTDLPMPNGAIGERVGGGRWFYFPGYCGRTCSSATVVTGQIIDQVTGQVFNPGMQVGYFTASGAGTTFAPGTTLRVEGVSAGTTLISVGGVPVVVASGSESQTTTTTTQVPIGTPLGSSTNSITNPDGSRVITEIVTTANRQTIGDEVTFAVPGTPLGSAVTSNPTPDGMGTLITESETKADPQKGALGLKQVDDRNRAFMTAALNNDEMLGRIDGLTAYGDAFHLRPGVDVVSAASDGHLTVEGDLDFSGFRYGPDANPSFRGSGEPGYFVIRSGGDLTINGSINDGFALPPATPDDNGWVASGLLAGDTVARFGGSLTGGASGTVTTFPGGAASTAVLDFAITVRQGNQLRRGIPIPFGFQGAALAVPDWAIEQGGWVAAAEIRNAAGDLLFSPGERVNVILPAATRFGAGTILPSLDDSIPSGTLQILLSTVPRNTPLNVFNGNVSLGGTLTLPADATLPAGTRVVGNVPLRPGGSGRNWAVAPMLASGMQSWSMRLASGSDLTAADSRMLQASSQLGDRGDLVLDDLHFYGPQLSKPGFSVVRTGTGALELLVGKSYSQKSLFGVYTAGTQLDVSDEFQLPLAQMPDGTPLGGNWRAYDSVWAAYRAYYPDHGGDFLLAAQGDITGFITGDTRAQTGLNSAEIGNWLWRQGGQELEQSGAWWINFGAYTQRRRVGGSSGGDIADTAGSVDLVGFTGIGTLGGGNVTIKAGGNAGLIDPRTIRTGPAPSGGSMLLTSTGLNVAVASSGRVVGDGDLLQTGGGNLTLETGGAINPVDLSAITVFFQGKDQYAEGAAGLVANLRGETSIVASEFGNMVRLYSPVPGDPRPADPLSLGTASQYVAGPLVALGDGEIALQTRGDLVLGDILDPGRVNMHAAITGTLPSGSGRGVSWFTLWSPYTSADLFSAGGDIKPVARQNRDSGDDIDIYYPSILRVTAASGSILFGGRSFSSPVNAPLSLLSSPVGQLELLAAESIYAIDGGGTLPLVISGADGGLLATPFQPGWTLRVDGLTQSSNGQIRTTPNPLGSYEPFLLGRDTATGTLHAGDPEPARFYANGGDIVGLIYGDLRISSETLQPLYQSGKSVAIRAGRDIVNLGRSIGTPGVRGDFTSDFFGSAGGFYDNGTFILHSNATDVSVISAGRDILYANAIVAGPGLLEVSAGRNVYQAEKGSFRSIGPIAQLASTGQSGADIAVIAGVGAAGPAYADFVRLYSDPANRADPERPLADQLGKVAKTYDEELFVWLKDRLTYEGGTEDALAYFETLPAEQQAVFARRVYFEELRQGGREYNNPDSRRFLSYLRGRQAIATLFPEKDASGTVINYSGSITMFGAEIKDAIGRPIKYDGGVRTDFGGDLQFLAPGGGITIGAEAFVPGPYTGVLTQGTGDIEMYSEGSILLGLSRVFTTFGGGITMWSAEGDINAGRGANGSIVFAPARRLYDGLGNVSLSPTVPTSGAGIGSLNPIPEVLPGDIDLIAPLGTIDAGEAGIRVSGNVNLAALHILNAANIQVKGEATGIPVAATVNTGALTAASSAASSVSNEAARLAERARPEPIREMPTILNVRFLGFGPSE